MGNLVHSRKVIKEKAMTEQELISELNRRIAGNVLQLGTIKYIEKIKVLDSQLNAHQKEITSLSDKIKSEEISILRLKGAVAALLELCAEEEGLAPGSAPLSQEIPVNSDTLVVPT